MRKRVDTTPDVDPEGEIPEGFKVVEFKGHRVLMPIEANPKERYPYSPQLAMLICNEIANKGRISEICERPFFPSEPTVRSWLNKHKEFKEAFEIAKSIRAERYRDEIDKLSDNELAAKEEINRDKFRFASKKWLAEMDDRRRFGGEKEDTGKGGVTINIVTGVDRGRREEKEVACEGDEQSKAIVQQDEEAPGPSPEVEEGSGEGGGTCGDLPQGGGEGGHEPAPLATGLRGVPRRGTDQGSPGLEKDSGAEQDMDREPDQGRVELDAPSVVDFPYGLREGDRNGES